MGEIDKQRVEMVQFHQNYSYEDFILGYKPNVDGGLIGGASLDVESFMGIVTAF